MKKKLMFFGVFGIALLLLGAVIVESGTSNVISSWSDLYDAYLGKNLTPPVPDIDPVSVFQKIESNDFSFMNDAWFRKESGGTYYVSDDSEELGSLNLPLTIRVYDYLPSGAVYILSSEDGTNFVSQAAFTSEPLTNETFAALSADEQRSELLFALWDKRCIWEITLKSESEKWSDLLSLQQASLSAESIQAVIPQMMTMSVPAEHTNDLWLAMEKQTNGTTRVNVFAPDALTNIEVFAATDLRGLWSRIATNVNPSSATNPATLPVGSSDVKFFKAITFDDADGDGVSTGLERYTFGTDENDPDTDGDGYADGPQWPAGYTNIMRGLNDAFPADAAAWRDTDGDGLPNEVCGTSLLVEDLDDDGDGTNEMEIAGIWISAAEISGLATNSVQWTNLVDEADQAFFNIHISDSNEWADVATMAKALVYARTGDSQLRTEVIDACSDAISTESGGSSLALGRNLAGFIIAADLVNLPQVDDMLFRDWLRTMLTNTMSDSMSLTTAHEAKANDIGTYAGGARAAIAAYLQEWDELDRVAQVFKGWVGDTTSYSGFTDFGTNLTWQADTNAPVGINPLGATIQGVNVDGALPVALQEVSGFTNTLPQGDYAYEHLQGALLQAVILGRAGYDVWEWEDEAMLRAYEWAEEEAASSPAGDDSWQPFIINKAYQANHLPTPTVSSHGKNIAPTDWTHQPTDIDYDGLPDWWELQYFGDITNAVSTNDPDSDTILNIVEYQRGTNPTNTIDSDGDGMLDDWEALYGLNPNDNKDMLVDSDGDRIPNLYEFMHGQADPSSITNLPVSPTVVVTTNYSGGIDAAVDYAIANDATGYPIVLLSAGTYTGTVNRNIILTNDNILIYATNATAVIDCQSSGRAFEVTAGRPVLAGLVIQNGLKITKYGGAIYSTAALPQIRNCVFLNNRSECGGTGYGGRGGAVYATGSYGVVTTIENCTFVGNYAEREYGAIYGSYIYVKNSLVWNNGSGNPSSQIHIAMGSVTYSCVEDGYSGATNTSEDPYLVSSNSWHLASTSSSCYTNGSVAYAHASDMDGELRLSADLFVDIGADEYSGAGAEALPGEDPPTP